MAARKPKTKEPKPATKPRKAPASPARKSKTKPVAPPQRKAAAKPRKRKPKAKPKPIGRPSKIGQAVRVIVPNAKTGKPVALITTVGDAFVRVLETGCSIETAASLVGINKATVYDWLARAEEHRDSDPVPEGERQYLDFSDALVRAREQVVELSLAGILRAGEKDWRALAWFLERSRPDEWGRSTRIDLGAIASDGGRTTLAELMAAAVSDPSTVSDDEDPDLSS